MLVAALVACLCVVGFLARPAEAEPVIPNFWDAGERLPNPSLAAVPRLRFLTTTDFPPFNYLDRAGRLAGFHVDLARAICAELDLLDRCQIQGLPWEELEEALARGEGEAILAGIAATAETRDRLAFSRVYLRLPARFIVRRDDQASEPMHRAVAGQRVGVLAGSAHERMLRDLFPGARPVVYTRPQWLFDDLKAGNIYAAFGDGMRYGFWLAGPDSENCCRYAGGPYLAPEYLGVGLSVAMRSDDRDLVEAIDFALREIGTGGRFAELYLRHFPVSFF